MRTWLVATLTLVMLASCTGTRTESAPPSSTPGTISPTPATTASPRPVRDYPSFTQALDAAGFTVREGKRLGGELFTPGRSVFIDDVAVQAYEYPNEQALDLVRSSVSPDGYSIPTQNGGLAMVEWVRTPHLYAAGKLLVLYVGDNQRTLDALALVLGPQFAGG